MLTVLYIHMTGAFGGSSRSLSEAIGAFPKGAVKAFFVAPSGTATRFFSSLGEVVEARGLSQFDNTRYGRYCGLRWLVLAREIALLPATFVALRRARRLWPKVDIIHVNEFTGLLPWLLARWWFKVPVVVHVRSVASNDKSLRTRFVNHLLREKAEAVVAIDQTVRRSLPEDLPTEVIHNAFTPSGAAADDGSLTRLKLRETSLKIGFVGNLLKVKGIHDLVEAARILNERGVDVEYIVVGDDAAPSRGLRARALGLLGLRQDVKAEVEVAIDAYQLRNRFHMVGFSHNIAKAYARMDVLCFPSHYDAPGRPIFEAAFAGVPSIVAIQNPTSDTLINGETGLAVPPRNPIALASAIEKLAREPELAFRMGVAAKAMAQRNFDPQMNSAELLALYRRVFAKQ